MGYTSKPCRKEDSYQIVSEDDMDLNLNNVASKLEEIGYEKKLATEKMAIMHKENKITIFPSGRVLIKNTQDEEKAESIADEIFGVIDEE